MPVPVHIRLATPEQVATVSAILYESFVEFESLYTPQGFSATTPDERGVLARMQEGPIWIAHRDLEALGTVAAVVTGKSVYIRGMAVLPSARKLGVGAQLLTHVEHWACENKCTRLYLSTTPFLDSAIRMYEKFGFKRDGKETGDLFGTPLFTMEKTIAAK